MLKIVRAVTDLIARTSMSAARVAKPERQRLLFNCEQTLPDNLEFKIAETQEEIEACLKLLHEAYVDNGFMNPDPSGLRVTIFHALPTTTTLCAKIDDEVVGTLSLIRDGPFGFPMQKIFDLRKVASEGGVIAEVSALAIHRSFRRQSGMILFPLMKFMYNYCVTFFDVSHLVIAVNPRHVYMYESVLFFKRLQTQQVDSYDYVNGAPAIGLTLDLHEAFDEYKLVYGSRPPERNLYHYFTQLHLDNIQLPARRFFTTNDPVMTPAMLNYFFNVRTDCFEQLEDRDRARLHTIYDLKEYYPILPDYSARTTESRVRHHSRFSFKGPGWFKFKPQNGKITNVNLQVVEVSRNGFVAKATTKLLIDQWGDVEIHLGRNEISRSPSCVMRDMANGLYAFHIDAPDVIWRKFIAAVSMGSTSQDLEDATQFLDL
jgi:hypothetical protein